MPREREQNRVGEQIVDSPMLRIKEEIVDGLQRVPQERVQNRARYTGKVFTVKMRHHRDDQASALDTVGFTKRLHQHNMPRSGDVMVPALQIQGHLVPRQGSTALSGADIACVLGVLKRERSWELQEVRRRPHELNAFSEEEEEQEGRGGG